ncbi:MAG: 3-phosphoshikimate 1-carboxyvinyltransferase [Desulfobacula sp.]|nr:3-phosphoshikimate 1-carboxyvinyltransferase [Desulfobacula sp.]
MKQIKPKNIHDQSVIVPGSKSISHRLMICASLCNGRSTISNLLESEDILLTIQCLRNIGSAIVQQEDGSFCVKGFGGYPKQYEKDIYLGNSGTSMRLLAGIAALGNTSYTLTGDKRMCERPMGELLGALNLLNIHARSKNNTGNPPVDIRGESRQGGPVTIDCSKSSQYLSSLLMMGALLENGLDIRLESDPVSSPYIQLTMDIMKQFNVTSRQIETNHFKVDGGQVYHPSSFFVEPDLSNAGYFWAIGAVTGKKIFVENISESSLQGDLKQIRILEKMGCRVFVENNSIGVCGQKLIGVDVDMSDTPDAVPAIAVVASFAKGTTKITNIAHLREKECDRIDAVSSQLLKMGIQVEQGTDYINITGGKHTAARIETFNDHRIAMAFSIPGLLTPGIEIEKETCVEKSFPNYWALFDAL